MAFRIGNAEKIQIGGEESLQFIVPLLIFRDIDEKGIEKTLFEGSGLDPIPPIQGERVFFQGADAAVLGDFPVKRYPIEPLVYGRQGFPNGFPLHIRLLKARHGFEGFVDFQETIIRGLACGV